MTTLAPTPRILDFRPSGRRPLWPVQAAMVFLDRHEDEVLALVQEGRLLAFDIARNKKARQYARIWRDSACAYKEECALETTLEQAVEAILPPRPALRRSELMALFTVSTTHIGHLLADGLISIDAQRAAATPGRGESPWITRASVAEFLKRRSI